MTREEISKQAITLTVFIGSGSQNKKYEALGYTKEVGNGILGFNVKLQDLSKGSNKKVTIKCKVCGTFIETAFQNLTRANSTGTCKNCQNKKNLKQTTIEIGKQYKYLTPIRKSSKRGTNGCIYFYCDCACGTKDKLVRTDGIPANSCGCTLLESHRKLGHFVKADHTEKEILNHLQKQSEVRDNLVKFNKKIAKDREFLCYLTGKNEYGNIEVHHVQNRKDYPELTYILTNLVCLRKDIHKEFHLLYGYRNNTVDQFYEFLTLYARN